ncbi:two-partner secretion domain-containing protein [Roseateles sp. GG27B]
MLGLGSGLAQAGPAGGQVVTGSGSGSISQAGSITTITQTSSQLSVNWQTFNIGAAETVNFVQTSAAAVAVNRIQGVGASQIFGHLNANGQIYLINPNGVLFGQGAQVNVGTLVASTLDLNGTNASASTRSFSGDGLGSIVNQGVINAAEGGFVALLGRTVSNQGSISVPLGTVALGAGSDITLTFNVNSLVKMQINQSLLDSLAENGGLIKADGGRVLMSAGANDALLASVVNNTGVIEAHSVENHDGVITLLGGMTAGSVHVGGTLDASAPKAGGSAIVDGGFIETSAAHVQVADGTKVTTLAANGKAGTWLIDPTDFNITAGSAALTTSGIGASTLTANLAGGNVAIATSATATGSEKGDINVNAALSWTAHTLTLMAHNDININAVMAVNDAAKLDLQPASGKVNVGFNADGSFKGRVDFFQAGGVTPRVGSGFLTMVSTTTP